MTAEEKAILRSQIRRLQSLDIELTERMPLIQARAGTLAPTYAVRELRIVLSALRQLLEDVEQ